MSPKDKLSTPMLRALYELAMLGGVLPRPLADGRTMAALEARALVRPTGTKMRDGSIVYGFALTSEGLAYVQEHWPSTPVVLGVDDEPEGGWTPWEGVGR